MPMLLIYRGLPASGKTTQATMLKSVYGGVICGRDHIRDAMYGKATLTHSQENVISDVQELMIRKGLRTETFTHVDDMNLRNVYVRRLIKIAQEEGANYKIIDMTNVELEKLILRNAARERTVPEAVIYDLHARFIKGKKHPLPVIIPEEPQPRSEPYIPKPDVPLAIMCDIDGTLAHIVDRDPYDGKKAWKDKVDLAVRHLIWLNLHEGVQILFCSGRSDEWREVTVEWLASNLDVPRHWVEERLFMRQVGDERKDSIVKLEMFDKHIRNEYRVLYVLDDRQQVVDAWRSIGLKVFQVAEGNF